MRPGLCSRRRFLGDGLALAGVGLLTGCGLVPPLAQPRGRVPRLGFLSTGAAEPSPTIEAFLEGLHDLGYVEGQTILIDWRYADGRDDRLADLAHELVSLKPDVVVTHARGIAAARQVTGTIPIVSATTGDLVWSGLATSLAHPGGNVTGLVTLAPQLAGKRLEFVKAAFPSVSRVGVLWNPDEPWMVLELSETRAAAQTLGVGLHPLEVRGASEFDRIFEEALSGKVEVLFLVFTSFFVRNRTSLVELATERRLPTMSGDPDFARAGGLLAYGPSSVDQYRRAASYVDRIIKGAKPADLPIEQPTTFDFVINLKTAQAFGLTIPPSVLAQATEIIQ